MPALIGIEGEHAYLAPPDDIRKGIEAAQRVFERNEADPDAAAVAIGRMENDELLTREEALLCVIWDEAEDAALRAITVGWLSRDVDIRLRCVRFGS